MKVVWSAQAAEDLQGIVEFIAQDSPDAARRVARVIFDRIVGLPVLPLQGRKREEDDGREVVFAPWPYIAVYEVVGDRLFVKAIRHTSRDQGR